MRKNVLLLVILFALCFAAVFPKTVLAAEAGETTDTTGTDYSAFFDTAASTIQAGADVYDLRFLSMKMYEAIIFDPRAFVEELAFREAWLQQAIADGMAESLHDIYLDTAAQVLGTLRYNAGSWDSQRYGLPVLYDDPTISEKNLLDFFLCRFYVVQYSRPQEYRDDYYTLFQEGYTEVHTESHSFLLWKSLKETPLPFLRALLQQDEQTQAMVIENILFYRYSPRGVVLINVLEETQTCENLSEAEKDLITLLTEGLAEAKACVTATGPEPQELAARNVQKEPDKAQPAPEIPNESQPSATTAPVAEAKPTVPVAIDKPDSTKNSVLAAVFILLSLLGGFLLGRFLPARRHNCE